MKLPYVDILVAFIEKHAPEAKIIIHQTCAYSKTCYRFEEWELSGDEMQNGCHLAGCVWFGTLFDKSPKEISYVPGEMGPKTTWHLRKNAASEVKKLN